MFLSEISIRRPVFTVMIIIALLVFGYISFKQSTIELFPKVDFPFVSIRGVYPGASPEVVESEVTEPIEEAISLLPGIKTMQSVSTENVSIVFVEFEMEIDIDVAIQDVRDKIAGIIGQMPAVVKAPVVEKLDLDAIPILGYIVSADMPPADLALFVKDQVKMPLQQIKGVGTVTVLGTREKEIRIWLDLEKMKALQVGAQEVIYALKAKNLEIPGGRIETGEREYIVKTKGKLKNVAEFGEIVIRYVDGRPIRIRDVAKVEDGLEDRRTLARFNGKSAVGLLILKQSGANTVKVADSIKAEVERLNKEMPRGIEIIETVDTSVFIRDSFEGVIEHIFEGGLIAVLIVFLFIRDFRSTIIAGAAIPTSIIATFIFIKVMGFSLNMLSLLALALSVGMLIDDAIVVLENIHRHVEKGVEPMKASFEATREIGLAVMACTFTIVAVFLPVAYMEGLVGRFFYQFGLTVSFAVLVSLFVSFTLTPMLCSRFLKVGSKKGRFVFVLESVFLAVEGGYKRLLGWSLRHKSLTVTIAVIAFISSFVVIPFLGVEFEPSFDDAQITVWLEAEQGTSIDVMESYIEPVEAILLTHPEITKVYSTVGGGGIPDVNRANIFVGLVDKSDRNISRDDFMAKIRKELKGIPGLKVIVSEVEYMGSGVTRLPINFVITGSNIKQLQSISEAIVEEMKATPGFVDVDTDFRAGKPEVRVHINREKAADLGVDVLNIATTINALVSGEQEVTKYKDDGEEYDVKVRLMDEYRNQPEDLLGLMVFGPEGELINLASIASVETASGPSRINHFARQREISINANLEDMPLGEGIAFVEKIASDKLEPGVKATWLGFADMMKEGFAAIFFAMFLSVILIYMVLASQYENFIHPLVIMFCLPLALIGAVLALLIADLTINILSLIGIIMLMGLVTKNGILIVDFTNQLCRKGMGTEEALMTAGPIRLRPILMTTFAMIGGMLPVALGLGAGSEIRAPMAVAVIGGLITSTLLTLIVVPVVYSLFDQWTHWFFQKIGRERP